ncbi:MAG: hypothetical protein HC944_02925 [Nanoarchaeota archaeon]|nr:hypothetical protein [Nanoarchaeota archaeon]
MIAIGEISARLVHDIRNPLTAIKSWAELIQISSKENQNEKISNFASSILDSVERMENQLKTVMDFVKSKQTKMAQHSLLQLISEAVKTTVIPDTVKISIPKNDVTIDCDASQIMVVFSNLITNSVQAMNENGDIVISFEVEKILSKLNLLILVMEFQKKIFLRYLNHYLLQRKVVQD